VCDKVKKENWQKGVVLLQMWLPFFTRLRIEEKMNYAAAKLTGYLKYVNSYSIEASFGELNPTDFAPLFKGYV
jgi:hypothetical protein